MSRLFARRTRKEVSSPAESIRLTLKHEFQGHEKPIWSFVFLDDNVHIVSGSRDGTMRKWNCNTGLLVGKPWKGNGGEIWALALSPDGKTIACGREDGSVQRWNTEGEMMEGVWTGHRRVVRSLSWSPSGYYLASGSSDGTILIREAKTGKVEVGPIKTKQEWVLALAYSPSGDRIASGGWNDTIYIWDAKIGELVVGPIKGLRLSVRSLVWSSDSSKIYFVSDTFARVFDSKTGRLLHHFQHSYLLYSIALSPTNNVLACVGDGIAQLWDTKSHQPLGQPIHRQNILKYWTYCVSFSRDGTYLAYGGFDKKLTLWMVKDIAPELVPPILQQDHRQAIQQETRPGSSAAGSSCLNADATGGDDIIEEVNNNLYDNFLGSSEPSLPLASSVPHLPPLFSGRGLWNVISRHRRANESTTDERTKRSLFTRALANSPGHPTTNQLAPKGKVRAGEDVEEINHDVDCSAKAPLGASKNNEDTGEQRDEPPADTNTPPNDPGSSAKLDSEDNSWLTHIRRKGTTSSNMTAANTHPEVVEIYPARGFQRLVAMKRVRKTKPLETTSGALPAAAHASCSSKGGTTPSQDVPVQPGTSIQAASGQGVPSLQGINGHGAQAAAGPSSHASPSHFVTYHDSDSDSSIQGDCNKFLDKICFPRGHYHDDS
ncbi:WD40-repeat-containing domain protein [Suillus paluster]|uniref:WD40-repeat-containing domain protein n=1 Tax=Suillus paluster TaxID=48578 RepID=UPI001B85C762|nr:WD40-repeat-containing domain protein [Suillus paluster]KAG1727181.1 WD40-repeat-containing domain protein [Suillus paluster]